VGESVDVHAGATVLVPDDNSRDNVGGPFNNPSTPILQTTR
jgi:hypothetical protein